VGSFDLGGSDPGCMAYADAGAVMSAYRRDSYNQTIVMLTSPADYSRLAETLKAMPALRIDARPEREVIREQYARLNGILDFAAYFVGTIMAIGATLGAANSMYAIIDSRRRDLATLRALGFESGPILFSTLTETTVLGIPGALIGAAAAVALFNNLAASPFGFTLRLAVTPGLCLIGVAFAMVIGMIAGLLPGLRAARLPVSVALSRA
jgi:putative ABC transport system permease protein